MGKESSGLYAKLANRSLVPLLALRGELDHRDAEELRRCIYRTAWKSPWLIVDLRGLRAISKTALRILMAAQNLQQERGGSLILIMDEPPSGLLEELLRLVETIPVVSSPEEAEAVTRSSVKAHIARERAKEAVLLARRGPSAYAPYAHAPETALFDQFG